MFEPHASPESEHAGPKAGTAAKRRTLKGLATVTMAVATLCLSPLARAQDPYEAVANLDLNGYWIEPGADADLGEYSDLALDAQTTNQAWFFVTLSSPADDGNSVFADDVYGLTESEGTVVVVSPTDGGYDVAVVSSPHSYTSAQIDAALDQAASKLSGTGGDAIDRHRAVFQALSAQKVAGRADSSATIPVLLGAGTIAFVGGLWWSRRKRAERARARDQAEIETARTEIRAQLDAVANYVVDIADRIDVSGDVRAEAYYREATETFTEVDRKLADATSLLELADLDDDIELARWKMEAADALVEGREVPKPPEPDRPVECFFDPTHRLGTVDAIITTPAGSKTVKVCQDCASKLERGEQPRPRMIDVGGEPVPAARAPRSHGGLGMGGIDIFDIIVGSTMMNRGRQRRTTPAPPNLPPIQRPTYDWGPPRTRSRRSGGVFGPDRVPRTNPNRRAGSGSRRSSTRRPTSRKRPRAGGSGRRIF